MNLNRDQIPKVLRDAIGENAFRPREDRREVPIP